MALSYEGQNIEFRHIWGYRGTCGGGTERRIIAIKVEVVSQPFEARYCWACAIRRSWTARQRLATVSGRAEDWDWDWDWNDGRRRKGRGDIPHQAYEFRVASVSVLGALDVGRVHYGGVLKLRESAVGCGAVEEFGVAYTPCSTDRGAPAEWPFVRGDQLVASGSPPTEIQMRGAGRELAGSKENGRRAHRLINDRAVQHVDNR